MAYVDVDVHHGDGVEQIFWDDPRVLTISLHETGQMLFPGTGFPEDLGGAGAEGTAVNVALPPGTADAGWLRAFHAVVPDLVREFAPDVLVTQHGCDSHAADPLAHLMLSVDGQRAAYLALHDLAHETAGGRWVATGGGGYALVEVVPRAWTHLLAIVGGSPLDPATGTPESWRAYVGERTGATAPTALTDGAVAGLPGLGRRLRPGHLAGPGDRRDAQGGLPPARAGPGVLKRAAAELSSATRHAVDHSHDFWEPIPHESQKALFSPCVVRSAPVGKPAAGPACIAEKVVRDGWRHVRREVPHRGRGRGDDARLEDDGVPPRAQR